MNIFAITVVQCDSDKSLDGWKLMDGIFQNAEPLKTGQITDSTVVCLLRKEKTHTFRHSILLFCLSLGQFFTFNSYHEDVVKCLWIWLRKNPPQESAEQMAAHNPSHSVPSSVHYVLLSLHFLTQSERCFWTYVRIIGMSWRLSAETTPQSDV